VPLRPLGRWAAVPQRPPCHCARRAAAAAVPLQPARPVTSPVPRDLQAGADL